MNDLSYKDIIQLDGAFSIAHINYSKSPQFVDVEAKEIAIDSRVNSVSLLRAVDDVLGTIESFDGTEMNCSRDDLLMLWKMYWLEYINAFNKLVVSLPESVVTAFIGRQAIELGLKFILFSSGIKIEKTHDLGSLSKTLFSHCDVHDDYMEDIDVFCQMYCKFIEGSNPEYFRFPQYNKSNKYFAGNRLDISWLTYNFKLILLKLLHFAGIE